MRPGGSSQGAHDGIAAIFASFRDCGGVAYHHEENRLSYAALHRAAASLAGQLRATGRERSPVLILGHRDQRFPIAYWACLLAGRACVPVEREQPAARIAEIAALTGAGAILLTEDGLEPLVPAPLAGASLAVAVEAEDREPATATGVSDDETAYILFSSGTTGKSKGIEISYGNLGDFIDWMRDLSADIGGVGCVSGNVRYCFDVSLFELWLAWLSRAPISVLDHRDVWNVRRYVGRYGADRLTTWVSTPALAAHWLRHRDFDRAALPELGVMIFCGEVLSKNLVAELRDRFPGIRIFNTYGPTECTVAVTAIEIDHRHLAAADPLPIGHARNRTTLRLEPEGAECGELVICGRSVGKGYLGAGQEQQARFTPSGCYRTGDWGRIDADGLCHFVGRRDREVKLEGHRVDLNAVEAAIRDCPGVADVVVSAPPAGARMSGLSAYVLGPGTPQDLRRLAEATGVRLPPYMVPRFWHGRDQAALDNSSKLDRRQLQVDLACHGARYIHARQAAGEPA